MPTAINAVDGSRRHRFSAVAARPPARVAAAAPPSRNVASQPDITTDSANSLANTAYFSDLARNLTPSLASVLRPAGATRWMLPSVAAMTPQYIEGVLRGALAGNHVQAWELFDLIIDTSPAATACVGEYVDAVVSKKLMVNPYAEEGEEPSPAALEKAKLVSFALRNLRPDMANDENDFAATIKDLLFARFHGQAVMEVDWYKQDGSGLNIKVCPGLKSNGGRVVVPRSTFWVHPVCYAWDMYGRLGLRMALESQLKEAVKNAPSGWTAQTVFNNVPVDKMRSMVEPPAWNWITSQARPHQLMDFPQNKFLIGINKFKAGTVMGSGSVLRPLSFWWIVSTYGADFALNLAQLFGIPFRKATYSPSTTEQQKAEIRQLLQSAGSMGYALLPAGVELDVIAAAGSSSESPQAFLLHFANDQIRQVILRQTMSGGTAGGGSKGVGKSFGDTEAEGPKDQVVCAGADYACSVINLQLVPYILNVNYGDGGDLEAPTCALVDDDVGGLQDAQRDQILVQLKDIPVSYLDRKYRIPKAAPGEPIAGKDEGAMSRQSAPATGDTAEPPEGADGEQEGGSGTAAEARAARGSRSAFAARSSSNDRRLAVQAAAPKRSQAEAAVARALAQSVAPIVAKLKAANALEDPAARRAALKALLPEVPKLAAAARKDPSLAEALARAVRSTK
jgi:phage gp29-like protein